MFKVITLILRERGETIIQVKHKIWESVTGENDIL